MVSLLSHMVANIYMKNFELRVINYFPLNLEEWKMYVGDVFAIWRHGKEKLNEFLTHLNILLKHIKFTIKLEKDSQFPFRDVLLTKNEDARLNYKVYRKKTCTDRYVHVDSHHHPTQKVGIIKTLKC